MRKFVPVLCRISLLFFVLFTSVQAVQIKDVSSVAVSGGCITSGNQTIPLNTTPATIYATAASGGSCSNYSYQWQVSLDNIQFYDLNGATGQNLSYNTPLSQPVYFQRKATCGSEVAFTGSIKVDARKFVYAKIFYENVFHGGDYTEGDVVVRFFSDAACTQPTTTANLNVTYKRTNTCGAVYSPVTTNCNGDSKTIAVGALLMYTTGTGGGRGGSSTICHNDYSLQTGAGYYIAQ
jgi:hypothetical protein